MKDLLEKTEEFSFDALLSEREEDVLRVCFVCTGNTCRSPMAAALLNHMAKSERDTAKTKIKAVSAGLFASGDPIAENAVEALKREGVFPTEDNNYVAHRSSTVDARILESCDKIIGISSSHAMQLMLNFPQYSSKIFCMPRDIFDPYGTDVESYVRCLKEIKQGIAEMFFGENGEKL
jgi:protein-tyrosine-phosphatase